MVNSQYVKPSCCLACFAYANVMLDIVLRIPTLITYCFQLFSLFRHSLIPTGGTAHQIIGRTAHQITGKTETEGFVPKARRRCASRQHAPTCARTARARSSLLAVLIRARAGHRPVRSLLKLEKLFFLLFFSKFECNFGCLNISKNSPNLE